MRRIIPVLLLCVSILPSAAKAEQFEVESKLTAATVYTNRATLTRQTKLEIPAGAHTIVFNGLPANVMTDSLRAEGAAKASVIFGAVASKQVMSAELAAAREQQLTEQLEALKDQVQIVTDEKMALDARKNFLTNLGRQAGLRANEDFAAIDLKPDQWAAAADTIYTGMSEILKAQQVQNIKQRDLSRQIAKVQNELNQIRTGNRRTYQVTVPVETDKATTLTVNLSYQIPNASWRPLYDARLETESGALELIQYGAVKQNTGEDWTDIALTLSTAQPHRGAGLPDMNPWWVDLYSPRKMRGDYVGGATNMTVQKSVVMNAPAMEAVSEDYEGAAREMDALEETRQATFMQAQIETGGFVSEYKIPGPSSVASDGTESRLLIGTFDTDNEMEIQLKPQLSNQAFLVSWMTLKGESPVLAGQVNLFRDGAFIGQTNAPLLRPGERHNLAFGIDDQVSLFRRVLKDERSEAGVIAKDNVLERHFVREIRNLHKDPVKVVMLETVPVSKNEQIKVEIIKNATTPGYEQDVHNKKGLLRWSVPLEPKEEKEVNLGWKVSWPKEANISGL